MKKTLCLLVGVVTLVGVLVGCGQANQAPSAKKAPSGSGADKPRDTRRFVKVRISGFAFKPDTVRVRPNDIIDWENTDGPAHSVHADDDSWQSQPLSTGQHFEQSFKQPGTYEYHCHLHPDAMKGKIIVENN